MGENFINLIGMTIKHRITLVAFSVVMLAQIAKAQCDTDQVQTLHNSGTSERNLAGYYEWESFTAGITGQLCQIDLMFCNSATQLNGTGTLKVYTGTGTSGTLLDSQAVVVNGTAYATNTVFWQSWTVASNPAVTASQVYTFQFIPTVGGGLPDPYLLEANIPDVYSGGHNYNLGTGGCSTFRTYVNAVTFAPTLNEPVKNLQVLLQDIPAQNELHGLLLAPEAAKMQLEIYDLQGRKLSGKQISVVTGNNPFTMDLNNLGSGIYLLRITGNGGVLTTRFVKM